MGISELINLSFDRVLTSGHCQTALEGAQELADIQTFADNRIEVLAGGGVRKDNVLQVIKKTHVSQVHLKCFDLQMVVELCRQPVL